MTRLLFVFLAACGSTTPADNTTPPPDEQTSEPPSGEIPSPPKAWAEMTRAERQSWMVAEVLPRMAPMFEEYDSQRFADFDCAGCHGADAAARNWAMPNPNILALHPTGSPEQQQMVQDHPEMVRFMFNRVVPAMQTLLGAEAYDAETGTGFSCYACHPRGGE
jgi:cytochrome c553